MEFCIRSGVHSSMDKRKFDDSWNYLHGLRYELNRIHGSEPRDDEYKKMDLKTCKSAWKVFEEARKVADKAADEIQKMQDELLEKYGYQKHSITKEEQVLSLLPPHRVTSALELLDYRTLHWRIAFKPEQFPAHAKHIGKSDNEWHRMHYKTNDEYDPAVEKEAKQLEQTMKPLVDLGFDCNFHIQKISKTNVIFTLNVSARS